MHLQYACFATNVELLSHNNFRNIKFCSFRIYRHFTMECSNLTTILKITLENENYDKRYLRVFNDIAVNIDKSLSAMKSSVLFIVTTL